MKKWIAFALVLVLALSLLAACGKDDGNNGSVSHAATQAAPGATTGEATGGDLEASDTIPASDGDMDVETTYPVSDGDMA